MSTTAKRKKVSFSLSPEAQSKIKIISGITMSSEDEVAETAINLLFEYAPKEIGNRESLESLINKIRNGHTSTSEEHTNE